MKICIVGGGSAGWMSAVTFLRALKYDVTLIESPNIAISGVGESTLGQIQSWIDLVGIRDDEMDFIKATDAVLKHSIKFTNFLRKDSGGFQYPFGSELLVSSKEWWKYRNTNPKEISFNDYGLGVNPIGLLAERGKFDVERPYAYQFDAIKFGQFLRKRYCQNVNHILADVVSFTPSDDGIGNIELDNGESITADLFVDCTGFRSKLLGEFLKEPFISYDHLIPNDTALACRVPYIDKEKQMVPYTECTAIDNGWVWQIPLWDKIGTGYVYSSKYISDEKAKQEFIHHLRSKGFDTSQCEFKKVPMKLGRYKRSFVKNVVAIGLSAGFIEPLEGNGLYSIHENLIILNILLRRGKISQILKDYYNDGTSKILDEFTHFVAVHYAFTQREDTDYWRDIFNKEYEMNDSSNLYGLLEFGREICIGMDFYYPKKGFHYIASGMGLNPYYLNSGELTGKEYADMKVTYQRWEKVINTKPSLYSFMKTNIYTDD